MSVQASAGIAPPSSLEPHIVWQLVLLLLVNGFMVPRALHTRSPMWFTGTCSGALLAAGQLAMLGLQSCSSSAVATVHVAAAACSAATGSYLGQHHTAVQLLARVSSWPGLGSSSSSSSLWPGAVEAGSALGLAVCFLLAWLVLCAAVLQWGWRVMLARDK
jgi:hypothetical protein